MQTREHGYTECYTPYIVNREVPRAPASCRNSGPDVLGLSRRGGRREREPAREQYLISTSEISLTNSVREQVPRGGAVADPAHRAQPVLPQRGGQRRARHARHDPPAPVRQGRDGADRRPETSYAARGDDGHAEAILQKLRAVLPRGGALHWRPGIRRGPRPTTSRRVHCRRRAPTARSVPKNETARPSRRSMQTFQDTCAGQATEPVQYAQCLAWRSGEPSSRSSRRASSPDGGIALPAALWPVHGRRVKKPRTG